MKLAASLGVLSCACYTEAVIVTCPKCGKEVGAADVNLAQAVARCLPCNAVFNCGAAGHHAKAVVAMPKGFVVDQSGPDFTLTRRWFGPAAFGLLFFVIFWDGFLVMWYSMAFAGGGPVLMKLFPLIHVAVGVGLTYFTACMFLNKTTIRVTHTDVAVKHGPLPWKGDMVLDRRTITQLYCEEHVTRGKHGPNYSYNVWAVLKGDRRKLVSDLSTPEQALFIEQTLEKRLNLADRRMTGEMGHLS